MRLRNQNKPFAVETKKSRKARAEAGFSFNWPGVEIAVVADISRSPSVQAADRQFREATESSGVDQLGGSVQAGAVLVVTGVRSGSDLTATRILPDLTRQNDLRAAGGGEGAVALRTRGPRKTRTGSSVNETPHDPETGIKNPAQGAISAIAAPSDQEAGSKSPVDRSLLVAVDRDSDSTGDGITPGRLKPARQPSPREIRRAAARGLKIDSGADRNRGRNRRLRVH
jgi:hypothetical protein